jgi:hypothetical protein
MIPPLAHLGLAAGESVIERALPHPFALGGRLGESRENQRHRSPIGIHQATDQLTQRAGTVIQQPRCREPLRGIAPDGTRPAAPLLKVHRNVNT